MTHAPRLLRLFPALLLLLVLLHPRPAAAGFDTVLNAWADQLTDFVEELLEPLTGPIVQSVSRPSRPAYDSQDRFWRYLADAGYEVASIETDIGLIPNFKVTLKIVRELSEEIRAAFVRALL